MRNYTISDSRIIKLLETVTQEDFEETEGILGDIMRFIKEAHYELPVYKRPSERFRFTMCFTLLKKYAEAKSQTFANLDGEGMDSITFRFPRQNKNK